MPFNLSGAFANSAGAFDKIRKGINEEDDRDKKTKRAKLTAGANIAARRGVIPQAQGGAPVVDATQEGSFDTDTPVTTQDWADYMETVGKKLQDAGADGEEIGAAMDDVTHQLGQKFTQHLGRAADLMENGDAEGSRLLLEKAYTFMPNNVTLQAMNGRSGLQVRGVLETDEDGEGGRGLAGSSTGGTVFTSPQQIREMVAKMESRPEMFGAMSLAKNQAYATLMSTRAGTKGKNLANSRFNEVTDANLDQSKAQTAAIEASNAVFEKVTESKLNYQRSLTELNDVNADLAPMKVANQYLAITNAHTQAMWGYNKTMAKGAGWKSADINVIQTSMDKADKARKNLYDTQAKSIMYGLPGNVVDALTSGLPSDVADLSDEERTIYDTANEQWTALNNTIQKSAQTAVLRQEYLGEFLRLNPSPTNGGLLGTTYEGIIGAASELANGGDPKNIIVPSGNGVVVRLGNNRAIRVEPDENGKLVAMTGLFTEKSKNGTKATGMWDPNHRVVGVPEGLMVLFADHIPQAPTPAGNTGVIMDPRREKELALIAQRKQQRNNVGN